MKKQETKINAAPKLKRLKRNRGRGCLVVIVLLALIALTLWLVAYIGGAPGGGGLGNDDVAPAEENVLTADVNNEPEPTPELPKSLKQEVEVLVVESRCEYNGKSYDEPQELLKALPPSENTIVNLKEFNASDVYDTLTLLLKEAGYTVTEKNE